MNKKKIPNVSLHFRNYLCLQVVHGHAEYISTCGSVSLDFSIYTYYLLMDPNTSLLWGSVMDCKVLV